METQQSTNKLYLGGWWFWSKYSGKEQDLHLKAVLETEYKVTTDWEGKFYIGVALKCYYEKVKVELSMPGYVRAALRALQHDKAKRLKDSPYPWTKPVSGNNN